MDDTASEHSLVDLLRVVRRRRWWVLSTLVAALAAAAAATATTPEVYAATSRLVLTGPGTVFTGSGVILSDSGQVETQIEILRSRPVGDEVRERLGRRAAAIADVRVSSQERTQVASVTVESTDPAVARDAANAYADVFEDMRRSQAVEDALTVIREIGAAAQEAKAQLDALDARIAAAQAAGDAATAESLRTQRIPLVTQYTTLQQRTDELQVDVGLLERGGVEVFDRAVLPGEPVRPDPVRNLALAGAIGLLLGVGLAFAAEQVDDTVKDTSDLATHLPGVPLLAAIPLVADWRSRDRARLVTVEQPTAPVSEAYRSLRTSIQFAALRRPLGAVLVTSPMSSEGKTTTLANIGVTFARSGRRIVVVDCDLRRPRLHEFFGVDPTTGFTSVLLGEASIDQAVSAVPLGGEGVLHVLPSGPRPPNPSELLSTPRVAELLAELRGRFDLVLLDTPPLLPVTDALVLSSRVDGVVLVASAGGTGRRQLARAGELLAQAEAPTLGAVLNGTGDDASYGYGYRYEYGGTRDARRPVPAREAPLAPAPAPVAERATAPDGSAPTAAAAPPSGDPRPAP